MVYWRKFYEIGSAVVMTHDMPLGPVMLDVEGVELTDVDREILLHPNVGGVIFFARNFESKEQIQQLTASIRELRSPALLTAVDQEGGRVQRFRDGYVNLPPMRKLGELYDQNPEQALIAARNVARVMATEIRGVGVDFSFAPVLDVASVESDVIGNRSFHTDATAVGELAGAFIDGMQDAGMAAVGKHFPGHGGVAADSHLETPVDSRVYEDVGKNDLAPYRSLVNKLAGVMTAHVLFENIDSNLPTYSEHWLKQVLRDEIGFDGVIFSDDLTMQGAAKAGEPLTRAESALNAGCDMVLLCNDSKTASDVVESLSLELSSIDQDRLLAMSGESVASRIDERLWAQSVKTVESLVA